MRHHALPYVPTTLNLCPPPQKGGLLTGRSATFHIKCNPKVALKWVDAEETPTCEYQIHLDSKHACSKQYLQKLNSDQTQTALRGQ